MRNRKALKCTLGVVVAALFLAVTWSTTGARMSPIITTRALAQSSATVATDKSDYSPEERVTVTGTGWQAGETVTLSVAEDPYIDGPHVLSTTADDQGNINDRDFVVDAFDGGLTFTLTATGGSSGQSATATFADPGQPCTNASLGAGQVSSVVGVPTTNCVSGPDGPAVENWEVAQGKTYTVTLTNVTDCANGGTDPTIGIIVKNSDTGNQCLTATKTANTGEYTFQVSMPSNACNTYPIVYCVLNCSESTGKFARRHDGGCFESHLRAATFDSSCNFVAEDKDCTTGPQGCTCTPPPDITIECGTSTDPSVTGTGTCTGTNCRAATFTDTFASGNCGSGGHVFEVITRTWHCSDGTITTDCPQTITIVDTTAPSITCPGDITANAGGACCANVNFTVNALESCSNPVVINCDHHSGDCFPIGTTTVNCTATDQCGNTSPSCSFNVNVRGQICATKFYDANADGVQNNGEIGISGWKITVSDGQSGFTGSNGTVCFNVAAGSYTVSEVLPPGNWVATTPTSSQVTVSSTSCNPSVSFGNYCFTPPAGGLTLGFWTNQNGKNKLQACDPAWRNLLNRLNLRNADGSCYTVPTGSFTTAYNNFRSWLLNATATNMAYMLSAQLATTSLDVSPCAGGLSDSTGVIVPGGVKTLANVCIVPFLSATQTFPAATSTGCPGNTCSPLVQPLVAQTAVPGSTACGCSSNNGLVTIGALRTAAIALLCAYNNTTASGVPRTYEECVKDILDMINNNGNPPGASAYPCGGITQFISPTPCPFTYPQ